MESETQNVGDKVKTFTIHKIVESMSKEYKSNGDYKWVRKKYLLIKNDSGQERVLEYGKKNPSESLKIYVWNKFQYMQWNNLKTL